MTAPHCRPAAIRAALIGAWLLGLGLPADTHANPTTKVLSPAPPTARITLEAALREATQNNEDWQLAAVRIERSRALRRQALAALLPQLALTTTGTYNDNEVRFGDRIVRQRFDGSAGAGANITLFDGTKLPLYREAGLRVELEQATAAWRRATVIFDVEQAFFQLAAAQRETDIAANAVQLRHAYVQQATSMAASGMALQLDVMRAEAQLLEADQALVEAAAGLGDAADALAIMLGRRPDGGMRAEQPGVADADERTPAHDPESTDTRPSVAARPHALEQRADLTALRLNIDALQRLEDSLWWLTMPKLELRADSRFGRPSFSAPDGYVWSVSVVMSWQLYDGGLRYARAHAARLETEQASLELRRDLRAAASGQLQAARARQAAADAIAVAQRQVQVARQAYDLTRGRQQAGLAMTIEVTEAADTLFRAEVEHSRARLRADLAASRWRYLGGLLDAAHSGASANEPATQTPTGESDP